MARAARSGPGCVPLAPRCVGTKSPLVKALLCPSLFWPLEQFTCFVLHGKHLPSAFQTIPLLCNVSSSFCEPPALAVSSQACPGLSDFQSLSHCLTLVTPVLQDVWSWDNPGWCRCPVHSHSGFRRPGSLPPLIQLCREKEGKQKRRRGAKAPCIY